MTYPIPMDDIKAHIARLLAHLPEGLMRKELTAQGEDAPVEAYEALVTYYAGDDESRRAIRALFYALSEGTSWREKRDGPTSGELEEQMGTRIIPTLPEELVRLCRDRLMPLVAEHSTAVDPTAAQVDTLLDELGIGGKKEDGSEEPPPEFYDESDPRR